MMEVMKFLHELQKWFNCTFFIDDKRKNVSCKGNNDCLLGEQSLLLYDDLSSNILSVNHVIETKVRGMKLESQGDTGDAAWQLVKDEEAAFEAYFRGAVDTLADLQAMTWPNIMDIYYVIDEEAWYQLQLDPTTFLPDWKALVVPPYIFSYYLHKWPTDLTITTQFSSLVDKGGPVYCSNLAAEYRNISPRLFFINRGVIPGDSHTTTYGMNLNDHLNLQMMNNAFYHSPGMFERFHKDWADWIIGRRKLVKVRKQIHFSELDIDFSKKYLLLGNKYFIKEMRVTLNNERIMPAELDLYLV
jgi:hypothetical protein